MFWYLTGLTVVLYLWTWHWLLLLAVCTLIWYGIWKDSDPAYLTPVEFPDNTQCSAKDLNRDVATTDKILVVGAGFCGLGIAAAFKRNLIPFDLVEADDSIGGNWYHGVYETVHIISSRKTTEYKDYPMPNTWSDFPSAEQMLSYLQDYARHYGLDEVVQLNTQVTQVIPIGKGKDNRGWVVTFSDGQERVYKGVVIANGHHWAKRMPVYPGLSSFAGEVIHSKDYRSIDQLKNKRVLVIGAGNSGCDIAVEASRFALSSHCSHRRGYWFLPRCIAGTPLVEITKPWMPLLFQRFLVKMALWLTVGPNEKYGLPAPDHELFEHHPTVNSELLHMIRLGRIHPHPDIHSIKEGTRTVRFTDGSEEEFDLIIAATGYHLSFPMLKAEVVPFSNGVPQLMAGLVAYNYKYLYAFGIAQVRYGAGPLITAGAESLAKLIKTQDSLLYPLADIMRRLGLARSPKKSTKSADILQDPHTTYRQIQQGSRFCVLLPRVEKLLLFFRLL